jgi:hypothetical protein
MDYKKYDFTVEVENLNYYLGLPKHIYTEAYKKGESFLIVADDRVERVKLTLEWEIPLEELTPHQINKLPEDTELTNNYARGIINDFRHFTVNQIGNSDLVVVDFLSNEIDVF